MSPAGWTTPADVRRQLAPYWESGRILAARLEHTPLFPLVLRLKRPDTRALADRFDEVRSWIKGLEAGSKAAQGFGYELDWAEINHRQLGRNRLPRAVQVPTEDDALRLLGEHRQAARFQELADATLALFPALAPWLARRALLALSHAADWPRVLAVLAWFRDHPRCGLYLRQLDIPGVDTKFIETRRGLLADLLDQVLPVDATAAPGGAANFERRYGLATRAPLVRFRLLDERLHIRGLSDLTVPVDDFARLAIPADRVFVTENEINGLAFPPLPGSLVIFRLGYGLDLLADIPWLRAKALVYWGDIDTHGFAMLDRLRATLPQARSLLMDRETLMAHRALWVREASAQRAPLGRLTAAELALFEDLRDDRLGEGVRLEQERVSFGALRRALEEMPAA